MSRDKKHLKDLPIQKALLKIMRQREKFSVLMAYNAPIEDLMETDNVISEMPEGEEKNKKMKQQQQAWEIMFADEMISLIKIDES